MPNARPGHYALTAPGNVRLYSTDELLRMPVPTWLIDHILPAGGFIGLYGPSGCGKSFIALDMAFCVASGLRWHERETQQGWVVYISGEGMAGLGRRAQSWLTHHGLDVSDADIAWLPEAVPIYDGSEGLEALVGRIAEVGKAPSLVIIDTLARSFNGNENEQFDMGRFVTGVQHLQQLGAAVLAVHHTNSGEGRERGSTAFRAATDTMIAVRPGHPGARVTQDAFTMLCSKQKEAEPFQTAIGRRLTTAAGSCVITLEWTEQEGLE